jgi:hypothetical protein
MICSLINNKRRQNWNANTHYLLLVLETFFLVGTPEGK